MEKLLIICLIFNIISCGKEETDKKKKTSTLHSKVLGEVGSIMSKIELDSDFSQKIFIPKHNFKKMHILSSGTVTSFEQAVDKITFSLGRGTANYNLSCVINKYTIHAQKKESLEVAKPSNYFDIYFNQHLASLDTIMIAWNKALRDKGEVVTVTLKLRENYRFNLRTGIDFVKTNICTKNSRKIGPQVYRDNDKRVIKPAQFDGNIAVEFEY